MTEDPLFELADTLDARKKADRLFGQVSETLATLLPNSDIRHVGATAVPGCLTKGDLDLVVRVTADEFASTDQILAGLYSRNTGSQRTAEFSAFEDRSSDPDLGIQLVAIDGTADIFHQFAELLQGNAELVREYNELKVGFHGRDMASYRDAKANFIQAALKCVHQAPHVFSR